MLLVVCRMILPTLWFAWNQCDETHQNLSTIVLKLTGVWLAKYYQNQMLWLSWLQYKPIRHYNWAWSEHCDDVRNFRRVLCTIAMTANFVISFKNFWILFDIHFYIMWIISVNNFCEVKYKCHEGMKPNQQNPRPKCFCESFKSSLALKCTIASWFVSPLL